MSHLRFPQTFFSNNCFSLIFLAIAFFGASRPGFSSAAAEGFVTAAAYATFLNDVAGASDLHHLYYASMLVRRSGDAGNYHYEVSEENKEALITSVSWWDAARYCNWKQHEKFLGIKGDTLTESGRYELKEDQLVAVHQESLLALVNNGEQRNASSISLAALLDCWGEPSSDVLHGMPLYHGLDAISYVDPSLQCNHIGLWCGFPHREGMVESGGAEMLAGGFEEIIEGTLEALFFGGAISLSRSRSEDDSEISSSRAPLRSSLSGPRQELLFQNEHHEESAAAIFQECQQEEIFSLPLSAHEGLIAEEKESCSVSELGEENGLPRLVAPSLSKQESTMNEVPKNEKKSALRSSLSLPTDLKKVGEVTFAPEVYWDESQRKQRLKTCERKYEELSRSPYLLHSAVPRFLRAYDEETDVRKKGKLLERAARLTKNSGEGYLINMKKVLVFADVCHDYQNRLVAAMKEAQEPVDGILSEKIQQMLDQLKKIEAVELGIFSSAKNIFDSKDKSKQLLAIREHLVKNKEPLSSQERYDALLNVHASLINCAQEVIDFGFSYREHLENPLLAELHYHIFRAYLQASDYYELSRQGVEAVDKKLNERAEKAANAAAFSAVNGELLLENVREGKDPLIAAYYKEAISYFERAGQLYIKGEMLAAEALDKAGQEMEKVITYTAHAATLLYADQDLVRECYAQIAEYSLQGARASAAGDDELAAHLKNAVNTMDRAGKRAYDMFYAPDAEKLKDGSSFYQAHACRLAAARAYAEKNPPLAAEWEAKEAAAEGKKEKQNSFFDKISFFRKKNL